MKFISRITLYTLLPTLLIAQAPDTLWTRTYGGAADDEARSIKQTSDGGYIIAGSTQSFGVGQSDVWLLKIDANGDTVWTRTYGGNNSDGAVDIQLTTDGGYIIGANTKSFGAGIIDIWLIKTDSIGDTIWTKMYGDEDFEICTAIQQTSDGGYIVTGRIGQDLLLLKTNQLGDTVWMKTYHGGQYDVIYSICIRQTLDGGYILAASIDEDIFPRGAWLLKTDADGDTIWTRRWETGFYHDIQQTADSGYILCGGFGLISSVLHLEKTDPQGDSIWTKRYTASLSQAGHSMQLTNDSGYIILGSRGLFHNEIDIILLKTNEQGDSLWGKVYGGSDFDRGYEVQYTNDGGYIIAGSTESFGAGGADIWIIKTEPDLGIKENEYSVIKTKGIATTVFSGSMQIPEGKTCRVFDITGRMVTLDKVKPGIYFVEVDGKIAQKVVKVK